MHKPNVRGAYSVHAAGAQYSDLLSDLEPRGFRDSTPAIDSLDP